MEPGRTFSTPKNIMSSRFYTADSIQNDRVGLVEEQAHHLLHVLRIKAGQEVTVFDGSGTEATARVESLNKREVQLEILQRRAVDRELPIELTLAVAIPKGDRQKVLVEKLVELGVTALVPITTERSVAQPNDKALGRLRKSVIEASKQCERNRLMQIESPCTFAELVADERFADSRRLVCTTHAATIPISEIAGQRSTGSTIVAIGPEGGFTAAENELAASTGFQAIQLGHRILRVETAAIVAATLLGIGAETELVALREKDD